MLERSQSASPKLDYEIGLDDLRGYTLSAAAVVIGLILPFGLMFAFSRPTGTERWVSGVVIVLYLVGGTTYLTSRVNTFLGGGTLVAGLLLSATTGLWIASLIWAIYVLPLLVLFASFFFGLLGGAIAAAVVTVDLLLATLLGASVRSDAVTITIVLTWSNIILAWWATKPIQLALEWSWSHYLRAEQEADQARQKQAELAKVVKSLNVAQDHLEQLNYQLEIARRVAEEARQAKALFAATVSHELRTPLNLIIGFSEMMVRNADNYAEQTLPPRQQRDVDTIYRNACQLSSLIDDILDLSQIDAARLSLFRERVTFADVAAEASAAVEPLFLRKGLSLLLDVATNLPVVFVDRTRIRQVMTNLLSNAARFTDAGRIAVRACVQDHDIVVSVSDTGRGISSDGLSRVFEEFHQADRSPDRLSGGSGLGLTISKRLVELHGGSMWVESQPGFGSTFYFTLPMGNDIISVLPQLERQRWAQAANPTKRHRQSIMVSDQDTELAHLLRRYFDGYEVVVGHGVAEETGERDDISLRALVLSSASETEKWTEALRISRQQPGLPVIVCPLPKSRALPTELGVFDYLVQPITHERLKSVLGRGGGPPRDILIVDDDPDMVDLLERMVQSIVRRAVVRCAYTGTDGLEAARQRRPDLILLDLTMPGLDGHGVLQALRNDDKTRDVRVVLVTARDIRGEPITVPTFALTRQPGLTVAELMRLLRSSIDVLTGPPTSSDAML